MEPIVTLPYSEWIVAEHLMKSLPSRDGYSVYAPLSRQEKGVDLVVTRRANATTRAVTIQVKYSRAYEQPPSANHRFGIWYRVFQVPEQADFIVLAALYPNVTGRGGGKRSSWWAPLFLLFTQREMADFLAGVRTRGGKPDKMFAFGFSSAAEIFQIRGTQAREQVDFSPHSFSSKLPVLKRSLGAA